MIFFSFVWILILFFYCSCLSKHLMQSIKFVLVKDRYFFWIVLIIGKKKENTFSLIISLSKKKYANFVSQLFLSPKVMKIRLLNSKFPCKLSFLGSVGRFINNFYSQTNGQQLFYVVLHFLKHTKLSMVCFSSFQCKLFRITWHSIVDAVSICLAIWQNQVRYWQSKLNCFFILLLWI